MRFTFFCEAHFFVLILAQINRIVINITHYFKITYVPLYAF